MNFPTFPGRCTIKLACTNATVMRRIAILRMRSAVGLKRQRQLLHGSLETMYKLSHLMGSATSSV